MDTLQAFISVEPYEPLDAYQVLHAIRPSVAKDEHSVELQKVVDSLDQLVEQGILCKRTIKCEKEPQDKPVTLWWYVRTPSAEPEMKIATPKPVSASLKNGRNARRGFVVPYVMTFNIRW